MLAVFLEQVLPGELGEVDRNESQQHKTKGSVQGWMHYIAGTTARLHWLNSSQHSFPSNLPASEVLEGEQWPVESHCSGRIFASVSHHPNTVQSAAGRIWQIRWKRYRSSNRAATQRGKTIHPASETSTRVPEALNQQATGEISSAKPPGTSVGSTRRSPEST